MSEETLGSKEIRLGSQVRKQEASKYIKMGLFICCVSNTHLESVNPQMPDTHFDVFLNAIF